MAATAMLFTSSGCGDSGATGGSTTASTSTSTPSPTAGGSISVGAGTTSTLSSASGSSITLTAVVKNSGNAALANQTVSFTTTDAGVTIVSPTAATDATGTATGTMTIGTGPTSNTNRTIEVVATTGGLTVKKNVQVVGSTVTVTGPDAVAQDTAAQYVVTVRDSASNALASQSVTVTSQAGNPITTIGSSSATDSQGQFKFSVKPSKAGSDTLTIATVGVSAVKSFSVSGDQLSFVGSPAEVQVNTVSTLTLNLLKDGVAYANQAVALTATRGTLSTSSVTTNSVGRATVTITSPTAGFTEVNASSATGLNATSRIEFVSSNPSKINLQPSPSTVSTNVSGSSSNSSQLIATVRDAADNPVKNFRVNFSFVADPSNGRIEPGFATTDSNGTASTVFIPGPNSSGNNAVVISASLPAAPLVAASQTALTVSRSVLVVRIGTGNEIEKIDTTKNGMPYTVIVSDSSGNPVKDVLIQASLVPLLYYKGTYQWNGSPDDRWGKFFTLPPIPPALVGVPVITEYQCANEDTNGNGQLDPGEDSPANGIGNGDGLLTPGNPAVVSFNAGFENGKTNALGYLDMRVIYPREFATWLQVRLRVTAVVAGTEGVGTSTFVLPGITGDYTSKTQSPPGVVSPYGSSSSCTVPN